MKDDFINEYMQTYFDEVTPMEFYRDVFPSGELAASGDYQKGKYYGVAVELLPTNKRNKSDAKRYIITDGLEFMPKLLESKNFIIMSPISYCGKSRVSSNARFIYALAIDLDGIDTVGRITDLWHQVNGVEFLPRPTYTVASGSGVHLYYLFESPIPCFTNITKQLSELKTALTKRIWNQYTTAQADKPQIQSLFQGFRLVGGVTKDGKRTRVYDTGDKVSIDYLNQFVPKESMVKEFTYKSKLTLSKAAELYPEWYDKRIRNKQKKGTWICKRALYDWWLKRLRGEITVGHRFNGIMVLSVYAKKCGISYEELEKDAFGLFEFMECLTVQEDNHFTREDILAALEMFNDDYMTYPIHSIVERTDIPIQRNKRNYQKQAYHLEEIRAVRDIRMNRQGKKWTDGNGRKPKKSVVEEWQRMNPEGKKYECIKETGLSKPTVYKYWK